MKELEQKLKIVAEGFYILGELVETVTPLFTGVSDYLELIERRKRQEKIKNIKSLTLGLTYSEKYLR